MKSHVSLPPFKLSATVDSKTNEESPAMIPTITPGNPAHVYVPMDTTNESGTRGASIHVNYRGRAYRISGAHLHLVAGKWLLRSEDYGTTFYHDTETVLHTVTEPDKSPRAPSALGYYIGRSIYSAGIQTPEIPTLGKMTFAKRLLAEFNAYYTANKAKVDSAILESNSEQAREDIAKMEQEVAEMETALAAKRAELSKMTGKQICAAIRAKKAG